MSHLFDPNTIVVCPFDANHKIAISKLHIHMVKCKKSHPELDKILETCPFNVLHRYLPNDKEEHIKNCIDRGRILFNRPIQPSNAFRQDDLRNNKTEQEEWGEEAEQKIFDTESDSREAKHSNRRDNRSRDPRAKNHNETAEKTMTNSESEVSLGFRREKRFIASALDSAPSHNYSTAQAIAKRSKTTAADDDASESSILKSSAHSMKSNAAPVNKLSMGRGIALRKQERDKI